MERRRQIELTYSDKQLTFSERNREDRFYAHLQDKVRSKNVQFIQKEIKDPDERLTLLMQHTRVVYTAEEISIYIQQNDTELYRFAWDSVKTEHSDLTLEEFTKLVPKTELKSLAAIILDLEEEDDGSKKKEPEPRSVEK